MKNNSTAVLSAAKRCFLAFLSVLIVFNLLLVPSFADSLDDDFWASQEEDFPEPSFTDPGYIYYLQGYKKGYDDGTKAGFQTAMQLISDNKSKTKPTESPTTAERTPPANGAILKYPTAKREAPLTIHTSGDGYYFFTLVKAGSNERYMNFFAHAGETVDIDVPIGVYNIYYAKGDTWYGLNDLFGEDTKYYRLDDLFVFSDDDGDYNGWELTLTPVVDGNLDTESVSPDDFPK